MAWNTIAVAVHKRMIAEEAERIGSGSRNSIG
jgi:hypothetical protein